MKTNTKQFGFTLIELLVTITIIGILATTASSVYNSAQQKSRDSVRQTDMLALKRAIEQSYGDYAAYPEPDELTSALVTQKYMTKLPKDPKEQQADDDTIFAYIYGASVDSNQITGQLYEISANYENTGNAESKEGCESDICVESHDNDKNTDSGNDAYRWEIGNGAGTVHTDCTAFPSPLTSACAPSDTKHNQYTSGTSNDGDPYIVQFSTN